ncbi:uncharacterized protein LOC116033121 [Ipomoea triloba]|uniref:uncharacterized protein LOC116033121 n=1 Tax=Ipomoea triloba TaxID=35885 RepID=UPI00125E795B|nr:uncharacterized protein LOC116033121 [Ipomoea triloba]
MWDVISDGPIEIMKVNPSSILSPDGPQYVSKPKMEWTSDDRLRSNLDNIAKDILFKAVDDTIFPKIRKCKTAKDVWDVLIQIGEGDEQEKDNKLTIAMKKFEDFKMLPSENIADMEARLVKVLGEISDLGKTINQKEISLKILRGLPSSWDMKVTAMRDHRDLKTVSTDKLFSDLKAYEFEMKSKLEEEREERTTALVAEQPSNSRLVGNNDFLSDEQFALLVRKFKKFMWKNNFNNSSQRNQGSSSRRPRREFSDDNTNLCYNCRKPGHFMAECPYPKVSKNQNKNTSNSPQEISESKDRRFKKDKRKALISDPLETSGSEESSSDESDSSTEDTALLCLLSITSESDFQEKCLMAHEVEEDEDIWYFDSGCSRHMTGNKASLVEFRNIEGPKVIFGGNDHGITKGIGTVIKNGLRIENVSYVEGLKFNPLSTSQFCDKGYLVEFIKDKCRVKEESTKKTVLTGRRKKNMYTWTIFINKKNEVEQRLPELLQQLQNEKDAKISKIRTDRGTEFVNGVIQAYCSSQGILHQLSAARTPQQNGVAERRNRTLKEAARVMISAAELPKRFWAEAINTACYTC